MELFAEMREHKLPALLALGLEGAEVLSSVGGRRFALAAGEFPSVKPGADVPADFYESLGHDAGALLRAAWAKLGGASAGPDAKLRTKLPEALANVSLPLKTTDGSGFGGKRRLVRRLTIREGP
jgi:hypothetical protein